MRGFRLGRKSVATESTPMVSNFLEIAGPIAQAKREAAENAEEMALLNRVSEAATEPVQTGVKDSVSEALSGRKITQETYVELPKSLEGDILHTLHKSNCEGLITLIDGKMHLKLWDFKDFVNWGKYELSWKVILREEEEWIIYDGQWTFPQFSWGHQHVCLAQIMKLGFENSDMSYILRQSS